MINSVPCSCGGKLCLSDAKVSPGLQRPQLPLDGDLTPTRAQRAAVWAPRAASVMHRIALSCNTFLVYLLAFAGDKASSLGRS